MKARCTSDVGGKSNPSLMDMPRSSVPRAPPRVFLISWHSADVGGLPLNRSVMFFNLPAALFIYLGACRRSQRRDARCTCSAVLLLMCAGLRLARWMCVKGRDWAMKWCGHLRHRWSHLCTWSLHKDVSSSASRPRCPLVSSLARCYVFVCLSVSPSRDWFTQDGRQRLHQKNMTCTMLRTPARI